MNMIRKTQQDMINAGRDQILAHIRICIAEVEILMEDADFYKRRDLEGAMLQFLPFEQGFNTFKNMINLGCLTPPMIDTFNLIMVLVYKKIDIDTCRKKVIQVGNVVPRPGPEPEFDRNR